MGSAIVGLNVDIPTKIMADINYDLVNLYNHIQNNLQGFIAHSKALFNPQNNDSKNFYVWRDLFNQQPKDSLERASLFLYMNRHCYNGVCRYNSSGGFNVPFGDNSNIGYPQDEITTFSQRMQGTRFLQSDFRHIFDLVEPGDVVYCDPPYLPLKTNSFVNYSGDGFSMIDQVALAECARTASARGATVIISNHDVPIVDELYKGAFIRRLSVRRSVSRDGKNRNNAKEILAIFQPAVVTPQS